MQPQFKSILASVLTSDICSSLARRAFGYGVPIFMLHRMREEQDTARAKSATSDHHLRRCLDYLAKKRYTFLSLRELCQALAEQQKLPDKCVVFTMDDGFEDQARIATPIFREYDCPATLFLITGMLDGKTWPWDDKVAYLVNESDVETVSIRIGDRMLHFPLKTMREKRKSRQALQDAIKAVSFDRLDSILADLEAACQVEIPRSPPPQYQPLTWEQARKFEMQGLELAPHTVNHYILSRLDGKTMTSEILDSWSRVKTELKNPSPVFCYPTGRYCDFGSREVKLVRESGFTGAVSTIAAQVRPEYSNDYYRYALPRYPLPDSFTEFTLYCSWFEYVRERNLRFWPR